MTQQNIEIMDRIVNELAAHKTFSQALSAVYEKRYVAIPVDDMELYTTMADLSLSTRAFNALMRSKLRNIRELVDFLEEHKATDIQNMGYGSCLNVFECILDYFWDHMDKEEKVNFLIDTVERNTENVRS